MFRLIWGNQNAPPSNGNNEMQVISAVVVTPTVEGDGVIVIPTSSSTHHKNMSRKLKELPKSTDDVLLPGNKEHRCNDSGLVKPTRPPSSKKKRSHSRKDVKGGEKSSKRAKSGQQQSSKKRSKEAKEHKL
jgi:hypothetical protein